MNNYSIVSKEQQQQAYQLYQSGLTLSAVAKNTQPHLIF